MEFGLKLELPYRSVCFLLIVSFSMYFCRTMKVKITRVSFSFCWWSHWKPQTTTKSGNAKCGRFPQPIMKQNCLVFLRYVRFQILIWSIHHQQANKWMWPSSPTLYSPATEFSLPPQKISIGAPQKTACFYYCILLMCSLFLWWDSQTT